MHIVYENIRQLRKDRGMSQQTLARLAGYTNRSSIAKIEKGLVDLPQSKLELLARALGTTARELTGWADTAVSIDTVSAGTPDDFQETAANHDSCFGMHIREASMEPRIARGDYVIAHCQDDAESGDLVIARISDSGDICRRLYKYVGGIMLLAANPGFEPLVFTSSDIENRKVTILGRVIELRARF